MRAATGKKHQTTLSNEIEQKIIRLFALGMGYADISLELEDLYAFSVSVGTSSAGTDQVTTDSRNGSSACWRWFIPWSGAGRHAL